MVREEDDSYHQEIDHKKYLEIRTLSFSEKGCVHLPGVTSERIASIESDAKSMSKASQSYRMPAKILRRPR